MAEEMASVGQQECVETVINERTTDRQYRNKVFICETMYGKSLNQDTRKNGLILLFQSTKHPNRELFVSTLL